MKGVARKARTKSHPWPKKFQRIFSVIVLECL